MGRDGPRTTGDGRSGPEPLGEILARLFTSKGWGRQSERRRLETAWAAAAGPEVAGRTRVGSLRRGVLEVEVGSGALLHELASFHKRSLLEGLKKQLPGTPLRDIKFRSGVI
jgi:predicted nucleic acid-binding Zn ribbon protein